MIFELIDLDKAMRTSNCKRRGIFSAEFWGYRLTGLGKYILSHLPLVPYNYGFCLSVILSKTDEVNEL